MKVLRDITELEGKKALIVSNIVKTWNAANITGFLAIYRVMHVFYTKRWAKFKQEHESIYKNNIDFVDNDLDSRNTAPVAL